MTTILTDHYTISRAQTKPEVYLSGSASADTSFEGRIYGSIILFGKQQILSCNTGRTIYDPFTAANQYLDGNEITEALLNHLEVAVRAYDPCLSCATHALGKMPLQITLQSVDGAVVDQLTKGTDGEFQR